MDTDRSQRPVPDDATTRGRKLFLERQVYEITIKGHLDRTWSEWFEGLSVTRVEDGTTVLTGPVADQPALHGILTRIRDLGLPLVSVRPVGPDAEGSSID